MSNHGLPASGRLLGSVDFNVVLSKRQRNSDQLFIVYAASNGLEWGRLGVTVSRKVSLRAVRRNRVKRLIRESFRQHPDIARGCDFVVIAKQATTSASNEDIIASLETHWSEAKARCGNS